MLLLEVFCDIITLKNIQNCKITAIKRKFVPLKISMKQEEFTVIEMDLVTLWGPLEMNL